MSDPSDDDLARATAELGEPELLFKVSRGRFLAKLGLGVGLILFGVVANILWWGVGQFGFGVGGGVVEKFLLFGPPLVGAGLLYHMYRDRGLHVLVYPAGLLRLRRGEVDSFPWAEIGTVRVKVQKAEVRAEYDDAGEPVACWLDGPVPSVKVWEAGVTVGRADGTEVRFGPVLSDYGRLAEEVQRRTFAALWPAAAARVRAGGEVEFDGLWVGRDGLRDETRALRWERVKEVQLANGRLAIKQDGRWTLWLMKEVGAIPNPHLLLALVEEYRPADKPDRRPARADKVG